MCFQLSSKTHKKIINREIVKRFIENPKAVFTSIITTSKNSEISL